MKTTLLMTSMLLSKCGTKQQTNTRAKKINCRSRIPTFCKCCDGNISERAIVKRRARTEKINGILPRCVGTDLLLCKAFKKGKCRVSMPLQSPLLRETLLCKVVGVAPYRASRIRQTRERSLIRATLIVRFPFSDFMRNLFPQSTHLGWNVGLQLLLGTLLNRDSCS